MKECPISYDKYYLQLLPTIKDHREPSLMYMEQFHPVESKDNAIIQAKYIIAKFEGFRWAYNMQKVSVLHLSIENCKNLKELEIDSALIMMKLGFQDTSN
ncbi:3607_t:CDS:2 [Funneliformis mosseae]|uniref:3607_t:CDS:1 n=1 Tax=Funneliformis mosseae TaxID=27381 RepID=A0A9N9CMB2_FUNMO|nr:3607_t:CDS:2 [Funneliformis mosseae]